MWIEIVEKLVQTVLRLSSLPAWGVWIEIAYRLSRRRSAIWSLPAWGVWIEMLVMCIRSLFTYVTPRMGSVD